MLILLYLFIHFLFLLDDIFRTIRSRRFLHFFLRFLRNLSIVLGVVFNFLENCEAFTTDREAAIFAMEPSLACFSIDNICGSASVTVCIVPIRRGISADLKLVAILAVPALQAKDQLCLTGSFVAVSINHRFVAVLTKSVYQIVTSRRVLKWTITFRFQAVQSLLRKLAVSCLNLGL